MLCTPFFKLILGNMKDKYHSDSLFAKEEARDEKYHHIILVSRSARESKLRSEKAISSRKVFALIFDLPNIANNLDSNSNQ